MKASKTTVFPERNLPCDTFGLHRVLDEKKQLPQAALKLDNQLPIFSNEILLSVERLNIDAASFVQMEKETGKDARKIGDIIASNCAVRGKQHNRVTGSGGMLIGTVAQIGSRYRGPLKVKLGAKVASLVSLTLTPLHLEAVESVDLPTHQVRVRGHAVLFESSIAALLPEHLPESVAMAGFDVAGAPGWVSAVAKPGKTLVLIGAGGKAGLLSAVAARNAMGKTGKIIAIEPFKKAADDVRALGVCQNVIEVDATDPVAVRASVEQATRGKMGDIVVNVASVPNTETSAILSCKPKGKIIFFSMATSFTQVALGAEGIASTATMIFGNGYYPNHARLVTDLLTRNKKLQEIFLRRYRVS